MTFYVMPKDLKNGVAKDIQVLNSERIVGYNTYEGMMRSDNQQSGAKDGVQDRSFLMMNDEAEYYNVTVNFVVKKGGSLSPSPATDA